MKRSIITVVSSVLMAVLLAACGQTGAQKPQTTGAQDVKKLKAGFVYIGPVGDLGWTKAHDVGREYVAKKFPWLETKVVESVEEGKAVPTISQLFQDEKMDVVFTTSFGYGNDSVEAAKKFPDKIIMHCSGLVQGANLGTYFADLYQMYYLNGLMAGALTKTNKVGYVGAFNTSEVIRHIDAFALGVKAINPKATVDVRWISAWYDPTKARETAKAMISAGVDALAFTEDTATVVEVGEQSTKAGKPIYTFGHYSPMADKGPNSLVSGQLVNWGILYEKILNDIYNKTWKSEDIYMAAKEGAAELGGQFGIPINPKFEAELKAKKVKTADLGEISVYDLVFKRLDQFKTDPVSFEPFTGPIKDNKGTEQLAAGKTHTLPELLNIKYYIDNVTESSSK